MKCQPMELNFVATRRPRPGVTVLACGLLAVAAVAVAWLQSARQEQALQVQIAARQELIDRPRTVAVGNSEGDQAAAAVTRALATPWAEMLHDLEVAGQESREDVAVLAVQPDRVHSRVLITAEARSLAEALVYIEHLQKLPSVRQAVLQSHEVLPDVVGRPVRIAISADWRQST